MEHSHAWKGSSLSSELIVGMKFIAGTDPVTKKPVYDLARLLDLLPLTAFEETAVRKNR
jgi:hypothetical protein